MRPPFQTRLEFDTAEDLEPIEAFVVDLDGYEGPLHVLLTLARTQKVDLLKLSITRLAEQYLAFVHEARRRRFSLAADYLVMAAWLAYLKSRLLLPRTQPQPDETPPEVMAEALAKRLQQLEMMRRAADQLLERPQLRRDVFPRGDPEAVSVTPSDRVDASLYDLMRAYVSQRLRQQARVYAPQSRVEAFPLEAARDWLRDRLPRLADWTPLDQVVPSSRDENGPSRTSYIASTFAAGLELSREGTLEFRQARAFDPLWLRHPA